MRKLVVIIDPAHGIDVKVNNPQMAAIKSTNGVEKYATCYQIH